MPSWRVDRLICSFISIPLVRYFTCVLLHSWGDRSSQYASNKIPMSSYDTVQLRPSRLPHQSPKQRSNFFLTGPLPHRHDMARKNRAQKDAAAAEAAAATVDEAPEEDVEEPAPKKSKNQQHRKDKRSSPLPLRLPSLR